LKSPGIHQNSTIKELLYHLKSTSAVSKIILKSGYDELCLPVFNKVCSFCEKKIYPNFTMSWGEGKLGLLINIKKTITTLYRSIKRTIQSSLLLNCRAVFSEYQIFIKTFSYSLLNYIYVEVAIFDFWSINGFWVIDV
jgi:hypothetical protein